MFVDKEAKFFYITLMNENYAQPEMPEGVEASICKGMYLLKEAPRRRSKKKAQLLGSGAILQEVLAAAELLEETCGVIADIWSVTSFNELSKEFKRFSILNRIPVT